MSEEQDRLARIFGNKVRLEMVTELLRAMLSL
jgi:hypothetical protein